jgi:ATP-dependent helicase/nuclease subunit B
VGDVAVGADAAFRVRVLIVPSLAAAIEWPRRLAERGHPVAGLYALKPKDLARALAEPALLGRGLAAWNPGHDAFLAARLLSGNHGLRLPPQAPLGPVSAALARTLAELRLARIPPERLEGLAAAPDAHPEDEARLRALADLYRRFHDARESRVADPATLFEAATRAVPDAAWLVGAEVLVVDVLDPDPAEAALIGALEQHLPLRRLSLGDANWNETVLAPLVPPSVPPALVRLRATLFAPATGEPESDDAVEFVTAPGEGAEVRAIARRLLRAAREGVPFEQMGVVLPRPTDYAPLFTDLLTRLGVPHRLHPSLPLRFGRAGRSLLLLLRARGLDRTAVMEFLTFAPVPWEGLLAAGDVAQPAVWDQISRDAQIVSGHERFRAGLVHYARLERDAAARERDESRRARRLQLAADADALLHVIEKLSATLDGLQGEASWPEWSSRLLATLDQWVAGERDREAVRAVLSDLADLGALSPRAAWADVEDVLEARLEWERIPLDPVTTGAIHVGALEAMAGLTFRILAIPGLVEGGYPGTPRPDPFLLDLERSALNQAPRTAGPAPTQRRQLSLFDATPATTAGAPVTTTQDRVIEARHLFHRAASQATERLILSYPRADSRTGRERMPSLFFVAAASALAGRPVAASDLARVVVEDDPMALGPEEALDASERDRGRVRSSGDEAARQIAAGSRFFRQSRLASKARLSSDFTPYDGLVAWAPRDGVASDEAALVRARLDPTVAQATVSASRLATYARCGFQYLLQHVLRLEPALEPEERKRLEPLERGSLFHEVAELFLRERRRLGELPVQDSPAMRARALQLADEALARLVEGSPPRFTLLWDRERQRFRDTVLSWLAREAAASDTTTPAFFEVSFGLSANGEAGEPHSDEPLAIDLGDGRTLRVNGKIDRIDRARDGTLVLRDYKTGRAPSRDDGGLFKGGRQLQIPFYILAAARLFPEAPVTRAFLDYVDGGRQVAVDPEVVRSPAFTLLLRGLADAISQGLFVQEPSACQWCDYTAVCGPAPLLAVRRSYKLRDPRVLHVLRLRDIT